MRRFAAPRDGRACLKAALLGAVALSAAACEHTRYRQDSDCQDISGIVGREWRVSFSSRVKLLGVDLGLKAGSTFPEITRQFRETLVMGDHLCRAAERGLISASVYERFLIAQLSDIHGLAIQAGTQSPSELAPKKITISNEIRAAAPARVRSTLPQSLFTTAPEQDATWFAVARSIYADAAPTLPPWERNAEADAAYDELLVRIEDLSARLAKISPANGSTTQSRIPEDVGRPASTSHSIFFHLGSDELSADTRSEIAALVQQWGRDLSYSVEGYSDISGNRTYNLQLSERRANAVAAMLSVSGARDVRVVIGRGATTAFGSDARNRLVLIRVPAID